MQYILKIPVHRLIRSLNTVHCILLFSGRDCISGLRKQPSAKSIRCPECRMLTKVSESIDALPVNWVVRRLVDSVKQGSTVYTQGKVPKCAKHSDPAILFCKSCLSLLCVECVKDHAIHINDTCSVDASVAVYHQFLGKTAQGVLKLMADYKADMDEWSAVDSQISLCFQEQKRLLLSNLDKAIAELQEKKTEIEKEVSDDQFRARKLATPQVVPFWRSLRAIEYEVSCLKLKSAKYTAGDLDWTALAKLMELSKTKRDEAPKKGLEPLNISFLNCDKARLKLLRQLIASQSGTPVTFSFPSLPFTLPHVTRKTFTCIGRESLGEPTLFEGPELGPILWYVFCLIGILPTPFYYEDNISAFMRRRPFSHFKQCHKNFVHVLPD